MPVVKVIYDSFNMPFNKRQWVEVRIYKNLHHFRAHDRSRRKGAWACYTWEETESRKKSGLFGTVNFARKYLSPAIVAHEFAHFILDYKQTYKIKGDKRGNERLCRMLDLCVATFEIMKRKLWVRDILSFVGVKNETSS